MLRQKDRVPVTIVKRGNGVDNFYVDAHLEGETIADTIERDEVTTLTKKLMEEHGNNLHSFWDATLLLKNCINVIRHSESRSNQ